MPSTDGNKNLGSSGNRWGQVRAAFFYGNGSNLTNLPSQTDQNFTNADHSKLDGIEAGATADQSASEIRTLVENATDSNVFTDADHTKLNGIAANATNVTNNNQISNGRGFITNGAATAFASGTRMLFQQSTAPTGWTKDTTSTNQRALRVVSGNVSSGGNLDFTSAFASRGVGGSIGNTTQGGSIANGGNNTNNGGNNTNNKTNYSTNNSTQGGSVATSAVQTTGGTITSTNSVSVSGTVNNHTLSTNQMPTHRHTVKTTLSDSNSTGSQGFPANDNHSCPRTTDRSRNRDINLNTLLQAGSSSSHNHGFSGGSHSHSVNNHSHGMGDHSHGWSGSAHNHSMPNHNHSIDAHNHSIDAHNHSFTGSAHNHSFSGTSINLAVRYLDVIIAEKD